MLFQNYVKPLDYAYITKLYVAMFLNLLNISYTWYMYIIDQIYHIYHKSAVLLFIADCYCFWPIMVCKCPHYGKLESIRWDWTMNKANAETPWFSHFYRWQWQSWFSNVFSEFQADPNSIGVQQPEYSFPLLVTTIKNVNLPAQESEKDWNFKHCIILSHKNALFSWIQKSLVSINWAG